MASSSQYLLRSTPYRAQFQRQAVAASNTPSQSRLNATPRNEVEPNSLFSPRVHGGRSETPTEGYQVFYVGMDFGTGRSSACVLGLRKDEDPTTIDPRRLNNRIIEVANYPGDPQSDHLERTVKEVPTALLYTLIEDGNSGYAQWKILWGWEVPKALSEAKNRESLSEMEKGEIKYFKLLLDNSEYTEDVRKDIQRRLSHISAMSAKTADRQERDVIVDFLEKFTKHIIEQLGSEHGYTREHKVYFSIAVPPLWGHKALKRMHDALALALFRNNFPSIVQQAGNCSLQVDQLILASEPEAHAFTILAEPKNRHFFEDLNRMLLLDIGSGTVDAIVFVIQGLVGQMQLAQETAAGEGRLCGSHYINRQFKQLGLHRLRPEVADFYAPTSLAKIELLFQTEIMDKFENVSKRKFDFHMSDTDPMNEFAEQRINGYTVPNLVGNTAKHFQGSRILYTLAHMQDIFRLTCEGTWELAEKKLLDTKDDSGNPTIDRLVLAGGGAQSAVVQNYIQDKLNERGWSQVKVVMPLIKGGPGVAASRGTIIAALHGPHGPTRIMHCSYGLRCSEPFQERPGHYAAKCELDERDGRYYAENMMRWILKKGQEISSNNRCFTEKFDRIIAVDDADDDEEWIWEEELYASDTCMEDHYPIDHEKNGSKHLISKMRFDLRNLRHPSNITTDPEGYEYYFLEFAIVFEIIGWNLYYKAHALDENKTPLAGAEEGWFSVAAAFTPGAK
ncbi:hypothetical protein BT63DRAFT_461307 [Microthyrium microscopicum]|uniref:Actin-like ATPase domain-containing protein n=1 Tax=Microthyrium microscopicum TaxID=703497 RepID=A0A6A6TV08_9PEZI|nr:hypothetical protein BT63DRAFT_461307 [Microthyrium microscopicum]